VKLTNVCDSVFNKFQREHCVDALRIASVECGSGRLDSALTRVVIQHSSGERLIRWQCLQWPTPTGVHVMYGQPSYTWPRGVRRACRRESIIPTTWNDAASSEAVCSICELDITQEY